MKLTTKPLFSVRELTYLALTTALAVVGRLSFQFIPNVQPMTAIFLILALQLGLVRSLLVCLLSVLITNFYLGMGVWTIGQLVSFTAIIFIFSALSQLPWFKKYLVLQIIVAGLCGFIYGFIISIIDTKIYGFTSFWTYYLQGVSFDALHATGNIIFYAILAPILGQLLHSRWLKSQK